MLRNPVLFFALPCAALAQAISFSPPAELFHGGAAVVQACSGCVAVADFNSDGKPDIAFNVEQPVPNGGVLLGNGDGTFRPWLSLPYPAAGRFSIGDFDGDRKSDLVFAGYSAVVYRGKGDGTFESPVTVGACAATTSFVDLHIADFNHDGKTDILCGTSLLLSNGDRTFRDAGVVGTGAMEGIQMVADFNGDGLPDILLRRLSGNLAVVSGRSDGAFGPEVLLDYTLRPQTSWSSLAGDFNGDGKLDLIGFSLRGDDIDFLPGKGDGTFGALVATDLTFTHPLGTMTATGDFNEDGKLDFVAENAVYAGNGDGTFRFPVIFGPTASPCGTALDPSLPASCDYSHGATAVGDLNGDGLPDLVVNIVRRPGRGQIREVGEVNLLLNGSPGDGFSTAGISAATATSPVGPGSIVSAYGVNLAPESAVAATNPAPTTLGGIRLHVRDRSHSGDTLAPLLYVSPRQINYILNSSDPFAWVDIERVGVPFVQRGMVVPIEVLAPGFFPAAYTAIAPGYLSLYGTGFAQASAVASSCTVGGTAVLVTYAGPQLQIAGLDQVNLLLPQSLAAAGSQPVNCSFQTADKVYGVSNTVNAAIQGWSNR